MLNELVEAVRRYTDAQTAESPFLTAIEGVTILRSDQERRPNHHILRPALCMVVQGAKRTMVGNKRFDYRAGQALIVSVEMPAFGRVVEANPSEPYLGLIIEFDPSIMREVIEGLDAPPRSTRTVRPGALVMDFSGPLSDCALRIVRLLETPSAIPILYPAIMREICYWILTGPHGGDVMRMTLANSHSQRVIAAIHSLRERFAESVRIDELASLAGMSPSAFHRQFKAITAMTPLQYQKQIRLLEARRLIVTDAANAETAAFQVGYESPSQFSREYSRMFGAPPRRDAAVLRAMAS